MKAVFICGLYMFLMKVSAQHKDYAKLRPDVMVQVCGAPDSSAVNSSMRNLLNLDTTLIKRNMHMYYQDLGQCYWLKSSGVNANHYLKLSIATTRKALYHQPKLSKALWNLACAYTLDDDCDNGKRYMEKYKQHTKEKYWDEEQIQNLFMRCNS